MNIVLLKPEDWIDEQRVLLKDQRATHIRKVLRASAGDTLRVGRLGGACGEGLIESLDAHGVVEMVHEISECNYFVLTKFSNTS